MIIEFNGSHINSSCMLYFYAGWNSNCNIQLDALKKIDMENKDLLIIKINTTKFNSLKKNYDIKKIPTYLYIENNQEKSRLEGYASKYILTKWLKDNRS